jgi:CHASE2 domain-containing sensor protein
VDDRAKLRRTAVLWFVAAALSLAAGIITWQRGEGFKWVLFSAAFFMGILGGTTLRRSRSLPP